MQIPMQLNSCPCRHCKKGGNNFVKKFSPNTIPESCNSNAFPKEPCTEIRTFDLNQQPPVFSSNTVKCLNDTCHVKKSNGKYSIIQPSFGLGLATDFNGRNIDTHHKYNPNLRPHNPPCSNPQWISKDPRLMSPVHSPLDFNDRQTLDAPPYTGEVPLNDIYNNNLTNYGKNYKSYKDINGGQIRYYIDTDLTPVLFDPLFVMKSNVESEIFLDPMTSAKFQTVRDPVFRDNKNVSDYQFDRDAIAFRENLMHSQMAIMNQHDYNHVWGQQLFEKNN
jgi:hypothetical protein